MDYSIAKLNPKLQKSLNQISTKMLKEKTNHPNPIELLSIKEIEYLQTYLETIKASKMQSATKSSDSADREPVQSINDKSGQDYFNPYEYGARQTNLGPMCKISIPISDSAEFPGGIRNVGIESSLLQGGLTHIPGQREITEREMNRFENLPFNPQNTRHIVWDDNMPRGGYSTRTERLET